VVGLRVSLNPLRLTSASLNQNPRPDVASCPGGRRGLARTGRQRWAVRVTFWLVAGGSSLQW
jgi:hypothetical protein